MDECELREQLELHHEASYGWALHCCRRNTADAEEVLQESYVKVLTGRARYHGKAAFKTWLFGVIRTTAANERRRHWLRQLGLLRFERQSPPPVNGRSITDTLEHSQQRQLLQSLLARLPARQQEVLHLVFYQDMTISQAAEVMGVSVGAARQHYERGKQRLRQLLKQSEVLCETDWR